MNPIHPFAAQAPLPSGTPAPARETLPSAPLPPPSAGHPSGVRNDSNQRAAHPGIRAYEQADDPRSAKRQKNTPHLPPELLPVQAAFPRKENETNAAYARRLNLASQQGQAHARVQGQPLTLKQLSLLSCAMENNLRQDPQLAPLPAELLPVRLALPRQKGETNIAYARRLNLASQQDRPGGRVQGQPLTVDQLASLSGATEGNLRLDPQLVPLPPELLPVRLAFPRGENEKALPYARRLNLASQQDLSGARVQGQPLTIDQLASLSGTTTSVLLQDSQFTALPPELVSVRLAFPRGHNEKNVPYARRLNLASQQDLPGARVQGRPLTIDQLASLSGAMATVLRQDPQLAPLPPELLPVRLAFPRQSNEKNVPYARRLDLASRQDLPGARVQGQPLTLDQLASLSGASKTHLRQDPRLAPLPPELLPVRLAFPRQPNEKNVSYAQRLYLASQQDLPGARVQGRALTLKQLSGLSGATESTLRQHLQMAPPEPLPDRTALPRNAMRP